MDHLGAILAHFCAILAHFSAILDHFCAIFVPFLCHFGHFCTILDHFAAIFAHFSAISDHFTAIFYPFGATWGHSFPFRGSLGSVLGPFLTFLALWKTLRRCSSQAERLMAAAQAGRGQRSGGDEVTPRDSEELH